MESTFHGIAVSPGIAIGPVLVFDVDRFDIPNYAITDVKGELRRLARAIEETRDELTHLYKKTAAELGETHADILNVHLMLLDDVEMRDTLNARLRSEKVNVEYILHTLAEAYSQTLSNIDDPVFKDRADDLADVVDRVLRHLLDEVRPDLQHMNGPSLVVSHELSPSDTATIDQKNLLGVVLDSGSLTSHTAILTRALGVPAVMGLEHLSSHIEHGIEIIVDGKAGVVILEPEPETIARYQAKKVEEEREKEKLKKTASRHVQTLDGVHITTQANVALPLEVNQCMDLSAEGIGLYRTEFLFLNRDTLPDEEEQLEAYCMVCTAMAPHPVTLRTMDIGGDKFVAHLQGLREDNPQLGWRAVRFCLERPDIFKTQLRAMLRASACGKIQIMFPMISGVGELRRVKAVLEEVKQELRDEGIAFNEDVPVGIMIEVPSAVALADLLAKECDFFSLGTNDLIQYSLAVDRVNEKIAHLYEPAHPAVIRMLYHVMTTAEKFKIPCSVCGEMAGDPRFTELLIGMGVTGLSMAAIALPTVRGEINTINMDTARELVQSVLDLELADDVNAALDAHHDLRWGASASREGTAP